jgi:hypothetical protein
MHNTYIVIQLRYQHLIIKKNTAHTLLTTDHSRKQRKTNGKNMRKENSAMIFRVTRHSLNPEDVSNSTHFL